MTTAIQQTMTGTTLDQSRFSLKPRAEEKRLPARIVLYGEPGVGKTTFGCSSEAPALVPTEEGSLGIPVFRIPNEGKCETWDEVLHATKTLLTEDHEFKTYILDTLNEAESLCAEHVCKRDFGGRWQSKSGKEGYNAWGKGPKSTAQEMRTLLAMLDKLREKKGMEIILLAHEGLQRTANALGDDFQKFAPDMDRNVWPVVRAWADVVGHATRDVRVGRDQAGRAKARAIGKERYIYWEGDPGRDAKARAGYELPPRTLLSYDEVTKALNTDWLAELASQVMDLYGQVDEKIQKACSAWLKKATGSGEMNQKTLKKVGKLKLAELANRLLANIPDQENESGEESKED